MANLGLTGVGGIAGALNFISGFDAQYSGFIASVDLIPTYFLPFIFPPTEIEDDFSPEYTNVGQPAGRYNFPVYKGMGLRTISFKLNFDASYVTPGSSNPSNVDQCNHFEYAYPIAVVMAYFEKFKMPKPNFGAIGQRFAGVIGSGLLMKPDIAEPAPPLLLLSTGITNFVLGYLAEAKVKKLKFTPYMMATRIEVSLKFLVTPDLVFTTAEDIAREVAMAVDSFSFGQKRGVVR